MCSLLLSHSSWYCWARAMSSWKFCLSVCFQVLLSIVAFNMHMCFRKYFVYGDTEYSLKNVSLEEKDLWESKVF